MKFRFLITTLLAVLGFSTGVFAHTVINIPLDSDLLVTNTLTTFPE